MFRRIKSLRQKLIIAICSALLFPMLIIVMIAQAKSQSVIRDQSLTLNSNLVNTGIERLETSYTGLNDIFRAIYLNSTFRDYLQSVSQKTTMAEKRNNTERLKEVFLSSLSSRSDIFSIIYIDQDGRLVYAAQNESGSYNDYRTCGLPEDYTACIESAAFTSKELHLLPTGPHMPLRNTARSSPEYCYGAVRKIVNTESHFEFVGTMFISLDLSDFEKMAELLLPGPDSLLYLCDARGQIIFDSSGALLTQTLPGEMLVFTDQKPQHELTSAGTSYVMVSAQSEATGWYLLLLTPQSVYTANAMAVTSAILLAVLLALILVGIITAVASRTISKPVEELAHLMDHTGLQHLDQRIAIVGNDEIARLGSSFNMLMDNLNQAIQSEYEMALQQKNAEIRALQAQTNPHFLYNVLQSMASMASLHHAPKLATMATALGSTMRYNIAGQEPLVPLRKEVEHTRNYLTIQKIRFGERLHCELNVPEYVLDYVVPRVSIQPIVENAIVHGFENEDQACFISISAWTDDRHLILEVADDGQGISPEILTALQQALKTDSPYPEHFGIGLANLNSRLHLLYGETNMLQISSDYGIGTVVKITIPAKRSDPYV